MPEDFLNIQLISGLTWNLLMSPNSFAVVFTLNTESPQHVLAVSIQPPNRGNVCKAVLFILTNTISFFTAGGTETGTKKKKKIFVLSQLLANVKNWEREINSSWSPSTRRIEWEGKPCALELPLGRNGSLFQTPPQALLPEPQGLSPPGKTPNPVVCCEAFQPGGVRHGWAKSGR